MIIIGSIVKKYFEYFTKFEERKEKKEQYYAKMKEEKQKAELEYKRIKKVLEDAEKLKKIFSYKVPEDVLIDIAELENAEKRDYNYLKGGLKVALVKKRISYNDSISIKGYLYDKYKEEEIW